MKRVLNLCFLRCGWDKRFRHWFVKKVMWEDLENHRQDHEDDYYLNMIPRCYNFKPVAESMLSYVERYSEKSAQFGWQYLCNVRKRKRNWHPLWYRMKTPDVPFADIKFSAKKLKIK